MNRRVCALSLAAVLYVAGAASATWSGVYYWDINAVNGGTNTDGYAYSSARPVAGDWTQYIELRSQLAALNVWSASNMQFNQWGISRGGASDGGEIVFKVDLSEPIASATWLLPYTDGDYAVKAQYSTNGTDWTTAFDYVNLSTSYTTTPVVLTTGNTSELYLRFASTGWFNFSDAGTMTYTAVPEPITLAMLAAGGLAMLRRQNVKNVKM